MKTVRISIAVVTLIAYLHAFAGAVVYAQPAAPASDQKLRVYYTEPLGTDDEIQVHRIEVCMKVPALGPLVCTEATKNMSQKQCLDKKTKALIKGTVIKGCVLNPAGDSPFPGTKTRMLTGTHIQAQDSGSCKKDPDKQKTVSAPIFALTDEQGNVKKTAVWAGKGNAPDFNIEEIAEEDFEVAFGKGAAGFTGKMYRNALCTSYDIVPPGQELSAEVAGEVAKIKDDSNELINEAVGDEANEFSSQKTAAQSIANQLSGAGCNNSNGVPLPEGANWERSTAVNDTPIVNCSARYLILGSSGIDIFGNYVGKIYRWAAGSIGIVSVLVITFSGVQISVAQGDQGKIDEAKNRILQSIVGLTILFLASLILYSINPAFFTA